MNRPKIFLYGFALTTALPANVVIVQEPTNTAPAPIQGYMIRGEILH